MKRLQKFVASISLFLMTCTAPTTNAISSTENWLYNTSISVQDVLNSGIGQNANEKILEKIINTVTQYGSDCSIYEKMLIKLSTEEFFINNYIEVDLGSNSAMLDDIHISELPSNKRKWYSTSIKCESARTAQIEVKIPNDLEISARLAVGGVVSNVSDAVVDEFHKGSISLILKDNSITKQFFIQANDNETVRWKIFHSKSVVSLDIASEFHVPIHNKLQTIFDEIESPLRQFLARKFDAEFTKVGTSVAEICSKFVKEDKNSREGPRDLYVIPNTQINWKGEPFISKGPILIDGLSSFDNIELIVSENKASSSDGDGFFSFTTPRYDDPEIKEIAVRIKINDLKGRADYHYKSKIFSITFILEFIEFEVKKRNVFQYEGKSEKEKYNKSGKQYYYPRGSYARSNTNNADVKVQVKTGQLKAKIPKSVIENNEIKSGMGIASMHAVMLKGYTGGSFSKSLNEKLNVSVFANCP